MALLVYVAQNRPKLDPTYIKEFELQGRDWEFVRKKALEGKHATDGHFVKACRALMDGAETWGNDEEEMWFLKGAVRFADEFEAWGGFRTDGEEAEKKRKERLMDGIHVL